jgi:uncharacterized membrane protein
MIEVDARIVINCPVEQVFAFLTDHRNDIRWQEGLLEVRVTPDGGSGLGTLVTAVRKFLSRRAELTVEISEFVPNQREAFRTVAGPIDVMGRTVFEQQDGITSVTQYMEMQSHGFFALGDATVAGSLRQNLGAGLRDAKDILEGRNALRAGSGG